MCFHLNANNASNMFFGTELLLFEGTGAGGDWLTEPAGELHYFSHSHLCPSLTTLRMIIIDIVIIMIVIIINIIFFISPLSSVFNCTTIFYTKPVDESKKKIET